MSNKTVEVRVRRTLDVQVTTADIINSLVVDHEGAVGVLQRGVGGQDGVVRLDNRGGYLRTIYDESSIFYLTLNTIWRTRTNLRRRVDGKLQLRLLAVVDGKTFHEERSETGTGSSAEGVEHKEALKTSALFGKTTKAVQDEVNDFLADGVMPASVVVRGIFLSGDKLLGME